MHQPRPSLTSSVPEERHRALLAVLHAPPRHRPRAAAIGPLLASPDEKTASLALQALQALGTAGIVPLHTSLRRQLPARRVIAVLTILGGFARRATSAIENVMLRLRDENERVRWHAALTLSHIGDEARAPCVGRLETNRCDDDETIALCDVLRRLGDVPKSTLKLVHARSKLEVPALQSSTCALLQSADFKTRHANPTLATLLEQGEHETRLATLQRVGENRAAALTLEPVIRGVLSTGAKADLRALAALTLARIGARSTPSLEALRQATRDAETPVRKNAVLALDHLVQETDHFLPFVQPVLTTPDDETVRVLRAILERRRAQLTS
ncbi:MAG: HEAT repeat domain-containing protein [Planctomycetes bacterium]|nr:HEAT repeat domain-containing protein [Planctomycetota bacterium]